ncbi:AAA family ATPase [Isoptericola sp. NEAU-Y5]|uniref:AAA family ATPase n=1 Tax=Isoptericola luteus TaxID=2879484 RepID=A0ABS7ZKY8_9MICO|nr:AAA family ATPase [Isoptericola sp. NEAU-Y5]MCA5894309.1 AAA family ATPase [Isoptericola sp. NEAU-Y5]
MPVGLDTMSLTRNATLRGLSNTAAGLSAGMTVDDVAAVAQQNSAEDASTWIRSLFVFRNDKLVEDLWVKTAKAGQLEEADALAWAARVWSEPRIAAVVEQTLTDSEGHFDPAKFSTDVVLKAFEDQGVAGNARKAASSLLNQAVQVPLFEPIRHGSTIVGADNFWPTAHLVPLVAQFVNERLQGQVETVVARRGDPIELALLWKANRWLGLSVDEFRRAARPAPPVAASARAAIPSDLALIDGELRRRGQVVLQGAPGVGKTFVAMKYVDWASADRKLDSHLTSIIGTLPKNQRAPRDIAQEIVRIGLTAVWDLTQFHPSYGYEDFVRTLAPKPAPGGVTFRAEHRTLSFAAAVAQELALMRSSCDVIIIVDEINRADIARVFGELLYALEYRDEPVRTPYAVDGDASLVLPGSVLVIGTMNTADRSIALIDYALRRRFTFIDLAPEPSVITTASWVGTADKIAALQLFERVTELFQDDDLANQSLAVGHSYFLPSGNPTTEEDSIRILSRRFAYEVVPLLSEYVAEGLVDGDRFGQLLAEFGVGSPRTPQDQIEGQVHAWLLNPPNP